MEKLKKIWGIIWIVSGGFKFLFPGKIPMGMFAEKCVVPFYKQFIETIVLPNSLLFLLGVAFLEIIAGVLILSSKKEKAKIGLVLASLMNLAFLPLLGVFTFFINFVFLGVQIYLLKELSK